jgi:hypothetical protein
MHEQSDVNETNLVTDCISNVTTGSGMFHSHTPCTVGEVMQTQRLLLQPMATMQDKVISIF